MKTERKKRKRERRMEKRKRGERREGRKLRGRGVQLEKKHTDGENKISMVEERDEKKNKWIKKTKNEGTGNQKIKRCSVKPE